MNFVWCIPLKVDEMTTDNTNIHCGITDSRIKKPIVYLQNKTSFGRSILMVMPFEYKHSSDADKAVADMIVQHDIDSCEANETKESRASVTMIPAYKLDNAFLREIVEETNYVLTNQTDLAIRLFMYVTDVESDDTDETEFCVPFFGTIQYEGGKWNYLSGVIKTGTLAYEHVVPTTKMNNLYKEKMN